MLTETNWLYIEACGYPMFHSLGEPFLPVLLRPTGGDEDVTVRDDPEAGVSGRHALVHRQDADGAARRKIQLKRGGVRTRQLLTELQ